MMSLVLLMLIVWLSSKVRYKQTMTLFVKEFKDHINERAAQTYLDPKRLENLDGRGAGVKATSFSTNGVKKRGGKPNLGAVTCGDQRT